MEISPPASRRPAVGRTRRLLRGAGAAASILALGLALGGGAAADVGDDPKELPLLGRGFTIGGDRVTLHDMDLPAGIKQVATGEYHSVALTTDGELYAWGSNSVGQLGNGTSGSSTNALRPVPVDMDGVLDGVTIAYVAAGTSFSLAIDADGRAYGWGDNSQGQLGNGAKTPMETRPVPVWTSGVLQDVKLTSIVGGSLHTVALSDEGKAYAWGLEAFVGSGEILPAGYPRAVSTSLMDPDAEIAQIDASSSHSVALDVKGRAYAWGANVDGQFGNGNSGGNYLEPAPIGTSGELAEMTFTQVQAGGSHSALLGADGRIYSAGSNTYGQMGNGASSSQKNVAFLPVDDTGALDGTEVVRIAAGYYSVLAEASDGHVYSWGRNQRGADGRWGNVYLPTAQLMDPAFAGVVITDAQPGYYHVVALGAGGRVYVWGSSNRYGQLGIGSASDLEVEPTRLPTHRVIFGSTDAVDGIDVKPDFHEGTIEVTTPAHEPGDVQVYLKRLW